MTKYKLKLSGSIKLSHYNHLSGNITNSILMLLQLQDSIILYTLIFLFYLVLEQLGRGVVLVIRIKGQETD